MSRSDWANDTAEAGNEGDVTFLEVSSNPVVSLFITMGKVINNIEMKRTVDLQYTGQHSSYPTAITNAQEMEEKGYHMFKENVRRCDKIEIKNKFEELELLQYKKCFEDICNDIDKAIRD